MQRLLFIKLFHFYWWSLKLSPLQFSIAIFIRIPCLAAHERVIAGTIKGASVEHHEGALLAKVERRNLLSHIIHEGLPVREATGPRGSAQEPPTSGSSVTEMKGRPAGTRGQDSAP